MSKFFQRDCTRFVKDYRERLNLSVEQLAEMADVPANFIVDIESGKVLAFPNSREIVKIYDTLSRIDRKLATDQQSFDARAADHSCIPSVEDGYRLIKSFAKIENAEKSRQILEFVELVSTSDDLTLMEALDIVKVPKMRSET